MPRSVVCLGIPVDLEEDTYTLKNGDRAGQEETELRFHLLHPLSAATGSALFFTKSTAVIEAVKAAAALGTQVHVVAAPKPIRSEKVDKYDRPQDWVKLQALAVS